MMSFKEFYSLWVEARNAKELLDNPENYDKDMYGVLHKFQSEGGGKFRGSGSYSQVMSHPDWNYVLKLFEAGDECYLRFIRHVARNQNNPTFPKLIGAPQRFLPNFKRGPNQEYMYAIRMEHLHPLPPKILALFKTMSLKHIFNRYRNSLDYNSNFEKDYPMEASYLENLMEVEPLLVPVIETMKELVADPRYNNCFVDIHINNLMQRDNGELVIIDPWASDYDTKDIHREPKINSYKSKKEQYYAAMNAADKFQVPGGKTLKQFYKDLRKDPEHSKAIRGDEEYFKKLRQGAKNRETQTDQ